MQSDTGSRQPARPPHDLWELPNIVSLEIKRVRYSKTRKHVVAGKVLEFEGGIEIVVELDGDIPVRALSAALFIGSTEVAENQQISSKTFKFFVLDEKALRPGAPVTLGWVGNPGKNKKSAFRYAEPSGTSGENR